MTDESQHWLRLRHTPNIGVGAVRKILGVFSCLADVFSASTAQLNSCGLPKPAVAALSSPFDEEAVTRDMRWAEQAGHHLLPFADPRYPQRLRSLSDAPLLLYVHGDPEVLHTPQIAIVGSRRPSPEGQLTARHFARHLVGRGLTITSGLALGIDAASHSGALDADGLTIAVAATGLDRIYPARHRSLAEQILHAGALVSEFPIGATARPEFFPRRNRIISGLSVGTLVVEAAIRSGSLTTARHAMEQGREVFAIPGSIQSTLAKGCHRLIKDGAKLVEQADDILEELAPILGKQPLAGISDIPENAALTTHNAPPEQELDGSYQRLLDCIADHSQTVDAIVQVSGFTAAEVASMLLMLELNGKVARVEGGRYVLSP